MASSLCAVSACNTDKAPTTAPNSNSRIPASAKNLARMLMAAPNPQRPTDRPRCLVKLFDPAVRLIGPGSRCEAAVGEVSVGEVSVGDGHCGQSEWKPIL